MSETGPYTQAEPSLVAQIHFLPPFLIAGRHNKNTKVRSGFVVGETMHMQPSLHGFNFVL